MLNKKPTMIDFYLISDSEEKPSSDKMNNLDYAGGLEMDIYQRLVSKGIIDSRFNYYTDFRWENQLIQQIDSKAKNFTSDTDVKKLKEIIDNAVILESGLIAVGD